MTTNEENILQKSIDELEPTTSANITLLVKQCLQINGLIMFLREETEPNELKNKPQEFKDMCKNAVIDIIKRENISSERIKHMLYSLSNVSEFIEEFIEKK